MPTRRTNLPKVKQLSRSQKLALFLGCAARQQLVPFVVGDVGVGKTAVVRDLADELGAVFVNLTATEIPDEAELSGLPVAMVNTEEEALLLRALLPLWRRLAQDAEKERLGESVQPHLLFIDEITAAVPSVQRTLLNLLSQRDTRFVDLPPSTILVAAGNFNSMSSHARDLPVATRNRLLFWPFGTPPLDEWRRWVHNERPAGGVLDLQIETAWALPAEEERAPELAVNERIQFWADVIEQYAHTNPEVWDPGAPKNKATRVEQETAIASPRSFFALAVMLAEVELNSGVSDPESLYNSVAEAAIGPDFGSAFGIYARQMKLPDPEEWISNPGKAKAFKGRADKTAIMQRRVLAVVTARKEPPVGHPGGPQSWHAQRQRAALEVFCKIAEDGEQTLAYGAARKLLLMASVDSSAAMRATDAALDARMTRAFGKTTKEFVETADEYEAATARTASK